MVNTRAGNIFKETVEKYNLLDKGDRLLVAVSGGPDSVCLLDLLMSLASLLDLRLEVFHLDHQARGEHSRQDAEFVKNLAAQRDIPGHILTFDVPRYQRMAGISFQEAARRARLRFLARVAEKIQADKIAMGHNAGDQGETILMRLLRGAGLEGLAGMAPVGDFPERTRAKVIRPLLEVSREDIQGYCREKKLSYRQDCSNLKTKYLRNKVRLELIPYLEHNYNPNIKGGLSQVARILSRDNSFMKEQARQAYQKMVQEEGREQVVLDIRDLSSRHEALQVRILRSGLNKLANGRYLSAESTHYQSILDFIRRGKYQGHLGLPGNIYVYKTYAWLVLRRGPREERPGTIKKSLLQVPGDTHIPGLGLVIRASLSPVGELARPLDDPREAYLDYESLPLPLHICSRWPGARFSPLGMEGTRKIKDFFIDQRVPREERDRVPLVTGENGEIVWVAGKRIAHPYRITSGTGKVLILSLIQRGD